MTRQPLNNDVIGDVRRKYKLLFKDKGEIEKEVTKFIEMIVDMQQSIALKYGAKPSIDSTADETYELVKDIYEMNDEPKEKIEMLKKVKEMAISDLKSRFKAMEKYK